MLKITPIHFKPIGVGRDFLLPFLSRKKGETNKNYRTTTEMMSPLRGFVFNVDFVFYDDAATT